MDLGSCTAKISAYHAYHNLEILSTVGDSQYTQTRNGIEHAFIDEEDSTHAL
jgi:hypothetical protein